MFKAIDTGKQRKVITLRVEGHDVCAYEGDTLAIALLNADVVVFRRTPVSGQSRAPLCLMGICFDCLVEVDGRQNVQACMLEVQPGMQVCLQKGARRPEEVA